MIGRTGGIEPGFGNQTMQNQTSPTQGVGMGRGVSMEPNFAQAQQTAPQQQLLRATLPQGLTLTPGQVLWGQVKGQKGNFFILQMGKFEITAQSRLPLSIGQRLQLSYTGLTSGNQAQLQLLRTLTYSNVNSRDISQTLTQLNVPYNERNMEIAKGIVEFQLPLTRNNMMEFSKALISLPRPMTQTDLMAASFLKLSQIPVTTNNILVLSNLIAQHPMLGSQLMELRKIPGKLGATSSSNVESRNIEVLEELKSIANRYIIDPKQQNKQNMSKNLENLAKEQGIEGIKHGFGGSNMEEGWELMKILREVQDIPADQLALALTQGENPERILNLAKDIEKNLAAHQLLNSGDPESDLAFYYLQIPLKLHNEETTVELKFKYDDNHGNRMIDPENTNIEFDVNTENLGEIHVNLNIESGVINVDIGARREGIDGFFEEFTPLLRKSLEDLGYETDKIETGLFDGVGKPLIKREDFEAMEKIDVSA
jgi:hypothetical protein